MRFQILISTVDSHYQKREFSLSSSHLIVNQLINSKAAASSQKNLFEYTERGLSKSRNHALDHAGGEICLLSDDDLDYKEGIESIIVQAFEENPIADIVTFQIETPEGDAFNSYKNEPFWHNKRTIMRVASVEMAFKRKSIEENHLRFDEHFGLGAEFPTGEENIFLSDALDKNLKVLFLPLPIVIHPLENSGGDFSNAKLIQAKGAMFERLFGLSGYAVSFLFALKKYKMSSYSLFDFFGLMMQGAKRYRKLSNR